MRKIRDHSVRSEAIREYSLIISSYTDHFNTNRLASELRWWANKYGVPSKELFKRHQKILGRLL